MRTEAHPCSAVFRRVGRLRFQECLRANSPPGSARDDDEAIAESLGWFVEKLLAFRAVFPHNLNAAHEAVSSDSSSAVEAFATIPSPL